MATAEHRAWIAGRVFTLLSHYWRDDDPIELTDAIGADWAEVLEGIPQEFIKKACIVYQREEPRRKPTPGAIYQLARSMMPKPQVVHSEPRQEEERTPLSVERRRQICAELGLPLYDPDGIGAAKRINGDFEE